MITFNDKVTLVDQPSIPRENKVIDDDVNEIKHEVNNFFTYSTNEVKTGEQWVDGKDIYRKTYHFNPSSSGEVSFTFDSTGMDSVWIDKTHTFLIRSNGVVMQGFGDPTNTGFLFDSRGISKINNTILFYIGSSIYSSSNLYVTINYTKS